MKQLLVSLAVLLSLGCQSQTNNEMEATAMEVVTFSLKEGVSNKEASHKLQALNELVRHFEGFIRRNISFDKDGNWIDVVYWTSKELAVKAADEVAKNQKAAEIFAIIDETSVTMNHYQIISSFK